VEYRILGPLEVVEDGNSVALGTLKERLVLGVLLLHANEFVSRERLIDELWGAAPPPTARKAVNVYVSKLRKTLTRGGHDALVTADGGYRLVVDPGRLDAGRVSSLIAAARDRMAAGESDAASALLREALGLWRGPTLAGLKLESVGRDEVAQLDELRLAALMDRIDCDLAQGGHEQVLGELQVLVREHPLRERLRAQQMLALYRADRQADALEAYRQARHALIEELGIEPSESLQRLQQAILRHDAALELPAGTAAREGVAPAAPTAGSPAAPEFVRRPRPRRLSLRRRHLVVAGGTILAAVAAVAAVLATRGSGGRPPPPGPVSAIQADQFARIDPATGAVAWGYNAGVEPGPMAVARNTLWLVQRGGGTIEPFDLRTQRLRPPVTVPVVPYDVAASPDGKPWISDRKPFVTVVLAAASGSGTAAVPADRKDVPVHLPAAGAEATGGGYLWVIAGPPPLRTGTAVSLIDTGSRRFASTIDLGRQTTAIAYGFGRAWIGTYDPRRSTAWLSSVRPGSRPRSLRLEAADGAGPSAVAAGDGSIWVLTSAGTLVRVDPRSDRIVARIPMSAEQPELLAVGAGAVWTLDHARYSLSEIDPRRNRVVHTYPLGRYDAVPCGIAATHDALFVAVGDAYCDSAGR